MEIYFNMIASAAITVFAIRNVWFQKMKTHAFVILYIVLLLGLLPGVLLGQLSSFTIILAIVLYGLFMDCTTRPQSICMGLLGYLISVVINNLISGIYSLFKGEFLQDNLYFWTFFVPLMFAVTYGISHFCGKLIHRKLLLNKSLLQIRQVWYLADVTLLLCSFVFAFNNAAGEQVGYPISVVYFNCLLFISYFIITTILLVCIFKAYHEKVQLDMKQKSLEDLQEYTRNLETMYSNLRSFKHDYINILTSLSCFIDNDDMESLKGFFETKILPTGKQITQGDYKLNQLSNIKIVELKSLLSVKLIYAHDLGINVTIDIPDPVTQLTIDTVDLARILGIFLDNAIEAALLTQQPQVELCIIQNLKNVTIKINNNYCDMDLPMHKLKQQGFTTKKGHQGIGLTSAQELISTYENVLLETSKQNGFFSQYMEIFVEREV